MRSPITDEWAAGSARAGVDDGVVDLLEEVRAELASLNTRLTQLSRLVERAVDSGDEQVEESAGPNGRPARPADGATDPRILAVQLALAGYPREIAETRLAGAARGGELRSILDDVYEVSLER
jgi:hypothetical protein